MTDQAAVQTCQRVPGKLLITSTHRRSGSSQSIRLSDPCMGPNRVDAATPAIRNASSPPTTSMVEQMARSRKFSASL